MFQIDKGIPLTKIRTGNPVYPFSDMQVGDSFLVPMGLKCRSGLPVSKEKVASAAFYYGKRHNKKFSIRNSSEGIRVWRVA